MIQSSSVFRWHRGVSPSVEEHTDFLNLLSILIFNEVSLSVYYYI